MKNKIFKQPNGHSILTSANMSICDKVSRNLFKEIWILIYSHSYMGKIMFLKDYTIQDLSGLTLETIIVKNLDKYFYEIQYTDKINHVLASYRTLEITDEIEIDVIRKVSITRAKIMDSLGSVYGAD
jgi:hypothetical protein